MYNSRKSEYSGTAQSTSYVASEGLSYSSSQGSSSASYNGRSETSSSGSKGACKGTCISVGMCSCKH